MKSAIRGDAVQVKVGQVWADNDPRSAGRRLRVLHLETRDHWRRLVTDPAQQSEPTHARCQTVRWHHERCEWVDGGPQASIQLARFRPTRSGYRLISDVPE